MCAVVQILMSFMVCVVVSELSIIAQKNSRISLAWNKGTNSIAKFLLLPIMNSEGF